MRRVGLLSMEKKLLSDLKAGMLPEGAHKGDGEGTFTRAWKYKTRGNG